MARHPVEDFEWEMLRGATVVGARRGGVPQMVLEWVLRQHGIEPFVDVEIITHLAFETAPGAFASGLGDYIAQFDPTLTSLEAARSRQSRRVARAGGRRDHLYASTMPAVPTLRPIPRSSSPLPGRSSGGKSGSTSTPPRRSPRW